MTTMESSIDAADGDGEAAQRQHVEGLAARPQDDERADDAERDREAGDDGGPPAAQEHPDDDDGEERAEEAVAHQGADAVFDEDGLVDDGGDGGVAAQLAGERGQFLGHGVGDVDGVAAAGLAHRDADGGLAVGPRDGGERRRRDLDGGDVAEADGLAGRAGRGAARRGGHRVGRGGHGGAAGHPPAVAPAADALEGDSTSCSSAFSVSAFALTVIG